MIIPLVLVGALVLAAPAVALPQADAAQTPTSVVDAGPVVAAEVPTDPGSATDGFAEIIVVVPALDRAGTLGALLAPEVVADAVTADRVASGQRVQTAVVETEEFQTLGMTWPGEADVAGLGAQVRTRADGEWSEWIALDPADDGPDAGTADAVREVRGGTDRIWVGEADAVQLSFAATTEGGPADLSLALVSSEPPAAAVRVSATGAVTAAAAAPSIISRAAWGASPQVCTPDVASRLVGVVVHHTAGSNNYASVDQAMQQIRNDQRYHIEGRGWCDIGYNFIVDKWGNIYEGRANSGSQPVIGVHAGGFNTGTVGISMLGSYGTVDPPAATRESVARVVAWRLGQYHRDPIGTFVYHTLGGENSRFPAGTDVGLPVVFTHRDVAYTACPGEAGYAMLPWVRNRARELIRPTFLNPASSPSSAPQGATVTLRAVTLGDINWHLVVSDARTGVVVDESTGSARESAGGVVATWDGRNTAGQVVGPGPYSLRLTGAEAGTGVVVVPAVTTATVTGSQNPPTVAVVPLVGELRFVPVTPTRLLDTRPMAQSIGPNSRLDVVVAGVGGVPADAKAVALNITAVHSSTITHIRAWPAGQSRPGASVLNGDAARSASAAGVVLGVGGEGKISLYNDAGSTHLIVDVTGYYMTSAGHGYAQLATATRVLDTRESGGAMVNGQRLGVTVAGRGGIPADASAVVMNVTSVRSAGNGYVVVVPAGTTNPQTSSVNHLPRQDVANLTTVPLSAGAVDVLLMGGSANVVLDVVGWFGPGASGVFTPITPTRAFDTRSGAALSAGQSRTFGMGAVGLPAGTQGVVATITATQQTSGATYLTAWASGQPRPGTSNLNTGRGRDQANSAVIGLGIGGAFQVYNNLGSTHVVGDIYGYYR